MSLSIVLSIAFGAISIQPAHGQEVDQPIYIVQEGDSLWDIAARFRISMIDLANANGIGDPGRLAVGSHLIIPGIPGVQGILTTIPVQAGESLKGISRRYQIPEDILIRLNHLTSPDELYVGASLVIPEQNTDVEMTARSLVAPGQSLFEMAIAQGGNPWTYVFANNLKGTWAAIPGDVLHFPGREIADAEGQEPNALPGAISSLAIKPIRLIQGKVAEISVNGEPDINLSGMLMDHELQFFHQDAGHYLSLQGVHVMTEPGIYALEISMTLPSQTRDGFARFAFTQPVLVSSGDYPFDPVLIVSPETIDPAVTKPEDAQWSALTQTATPEKLWQGLFTSPAPPPFNDCWPSRFGNRRSYNGSEYIYFHSGLDFCGGVGTEILAPAGGRVVFASPLTVRGNATLIDHGWGIYSGYLHQSEILVKVGDMVQQGQLIGRVGGTGRVTGPHLHWEIWAGGVQVDPLDWLSQEYPG